LLVQPKGGKPPPGTVLPCRIAEDQKIDKNRDFDAVAEEIFVK